MATVGPWHIDIRPWQSWRSTQGTWARSQSSGALGGGWVYNSATTGDNIYWDVPLTAGTWTITTIHNAISATGDDSVTVKLDSTTVGSIDNATANADDQVSQISGITVATSAMYALSYTTTDNKYFRPQHITLRRTA